MKKPTGWDEAQAFDGERESLELGGHVCVIKQASVGETSTNKEQLILLLDIAEGPQKGFYQKQFDSDRRETPKWGCVYRQLTQGKSLPYFKGLISAIEKSNPGYKWNFEEKTLKGKLIGGVFGREQFRGTDTELHWSTKCRFIRSIESIHKGVEVPEDKYLDGEKHKGETSYRKDDFEELPDDDTLPFD